MTQGCDDKNCPYRERTELANENDMLRLALKEIVATKTQHLRSSQMQAALHEVKDKARRALQMCRADALERSLPWL